MGHCRGPNAWQEDDRVMGREEVLVIMMGPSEDPHNLFQLKSFVHIERSNFHQAGEEYPLLPRPVKKADGTLEAASGICPYSHYSRLWITLRGGWWRSVPTALGSVPGLALSGPRRWHLIGLLRLPTFIKCSIVSVLGSRTGKGLQISVHTLQVGDKCSFIWTKINL